jgi:hypothetical protein
MRVATVVVRTLAALVCDGEYRPTLAPGRVPFERLVLAKHGLLELLQRLARLEAELADQVVARPRTKRQLLTTACAAGLLCATALLTTGAAFAESPGEPTHIFDSDSGSFVIPAGERCDFAYEISYTIDFNATL